MGIRERLRETRPRYDQNSGELMHHAFWNRDGEEAADIIDALVAALDRAYQTMKDMPDFFEEGSHERKALQVEADAIKNALALARGEG